MFHCVDKKVWIQISWLHQKLADLDLQLSKKKIIELLKSCTGGALIMSNMVGKTPD